MAFQVMHYQIALQSISDTGLVRHNNEDSYKLLKDEQFFVLADGMGGHQAGEVASRTAVEHLCRLFQQHSDLLHIEIHLAKKILKEMIQEVNALIYRLSRENPHLRGMGTTLCCFFFHPVGLVFGHVGDSRIYRFRKGKLEQLTQDHSLLRELIDLGQLSEQQAEDFLYKNIITKAIGTEPTVDPSISDTSLEVDDILMTCSDGLSDLITLKDMQDIISRFPDDAARLLVEKAKKNGGYDNITVVLVKIQGKNGSALS